MKLAVIVVFTHKPTLEWYERISLDRCRKVFSENHDVILACPKDLCVDEHLNIFPGLRIQYFPRENFQTIQAYNRLKYTLEFYKLFSMYQFLLTYELDAFVFRDELIDWCEQRWDFIGAPIFKGYYDAEPSAPVHCVGNSGFSLRNIPECVKILSSRIRLANPFSVIAPYRVNKISLRYASKTFLRLWLKPKRFTHAHEHLNINEDLFWCRNVPQRFPKYKIADSKTAARFSFDGSPSRLFRESNNQLPFGCHKWMDIEPEFWRPIIESYGYHWKININK